MAHFLEDLDLARDPLDVLLVIDLLLLQDFHSNLQPNAGSGSYITKIMVGHERNEFRVIRKQYICGC